MVFVFEEKEGLRELPKLPEKGGMKKKNRRL